MQFKSHLHHEASTYFFIGMDTAQWCSRNTSCPLRVCFFPLITSLIPCNHCGYIHHPPARSLKVRHWILFVLKSVEYIYIRIYVCIYINNVYIQHCA